MQAPAVTTVTRWLRSRRGVRIALLLSPAGVVVAVFLAGGVGQALAQSFGYQPYLPGWHWSTSAWTQLWHDPAVRASVPLTLRVSLLSTLFAVVLGTGAALGLRRFGRGRRAAEAVFRTNLAVPHLVGALCMALLLGQSGLLARAGHALGLVGAPSSFPALTADRFGWGVIAEYTWKETPFIGVVALAALSRGVSELEDAARTLGASAQQRLRHVTLPLVAPPVAAASTLTLAFAVGSYEVPYLLGRPYPATLPVVALQAYRDTDLTARPQAMAVAVLVSVFSVVLLALYLAVTSRLARRAL